MFTGKKQVLLTLTLAICSLGLMASQKKSYLNQLKGWWYDTPAKELEKAKESEIAEMLAKNVGAQPREIKNLIASFAEKDEYVLFKTLDKAKNQLLVAFNEDGTALTSVGRIDVDNFKVVTRSMKNGEIIT